MHQVLRAERCGDGVNVVWEKRGREVFLYISFTRLVDLGVNALDLLKNPRNYGFDEEEAMLSLIT